MAFMQDNFSPVSSSASPAPKLWAYSSATDTLSTISGSGYFIEKRFQLGENDYIFVVGSNGSGLFQVTSDTSTIITTESAAAAGSTGLTFGGTISINADDTKFDIAAGAGLVVDYSDPQNPVEMPVAWDALIAVSLTTPSNAVTFIGIDSAGAVHQQGTSFDEEDRREFVRLGAVTHIAASTITNASTVPVIAYDTNATLVDFVNAAGVRNRTGNIYTSSSLLTIDKSAGTFLRYAGNYTVDPANPNVVTSAASTQQFFLRMMRDGSGGWSTAVQFSLDPENYDDGSGSLQPVTENFWQVFYVWNGAAIGSDFTLIQPGQNLYPNKDAAQNSINLQEIEINPSLSSTVRRAAIVVKQGTTDLSSDAFFYEFDDTGIIARSPTFNVSSVISKSYPFQSSGIPAGTHYVAGFYEAPATDANLTQASTTVTQGNSAEGHGSHAFAVFGAAAAASGVVQLVVSGVSIGDAGTRTPADSETLTLDAESLTLNDYMETKKKWIGTVTWTLSLASGSGNFSMDFNYGFVKHDDFGNRNFTITDIEIVGQANANDAAFDVQLIPHRETGWIYSAAAFVPGITPVATMQNDYGTEAGIRNNQDFSWKRSGLSEVVGGNNGEGVLVRIITGASGSVQIAGTHLTVEV